MSAPAATHDIRVTSLSPSTTDETLSHFFSFCGKISGIKREGTTVAIISFVKESAAKTALLLEGGNLDGEHISVTTLAGEKSGLAGTDVVGELKEGEDVEQEDKPHSAIAAEYLAHGYLLSDAAIERAIAADKQYGISTRFLSLFNPLATRVSGVAQPHLDKATTKLAEVDSKQGLSLKATAAATIGQHYYKTALASAFGAKVHAFYTSTSKQVAEVHEEALRIKEDKLKAAQAAAVPLPTATTGDVPVVEKGEKTHLV